jgi:uncharacterized delta-60 repeat protein
MKRSRKRIAAGGIAQPKRAILAVAFMSLLLTWNFPVSASSKAGDLDPHFGADGKVTADFFSYSSGATAIAVQPDGKVVAAGSTWIGANFLFALARFNMDGTPDATFGSLGGVITDFGEGRDIIKDMALLPNGKIVAAGEAGGDFGVARYNSDGTLDTTFGSGGKVLTDFFGSSDLGRALVVQDDAKILVAGLVASLANQSSFGLVRYNSDGSLDESFGDNGRVVTEMGSIAFAYGIGIQSSGKIVVGGTSHGANSNFALARYKRNGKLDPSFGTDGKVFTDFDGDYDDANSMKILPDDKIVLAGCTVSDGRYGFALARYNANGSLDETFGAGGKASTHYSQSHYVANAVTLQADGKIVAAGYRDLGGDYDFVLARYNTNGGLDSSFSGGMVLTDFSNGFDNAGAVTIGQDGRILVGGEGEDSTGRLNLAVACYLAKGTPDITSAVVSGKKLFVYGTYFDEGSDIYLDGEKQKTKNDSDNPETVLIGKKAGKKIAPGQTVTLQVKCPDGRESREYSFTRPVE